MFYRKWKIRNIVLDVQSAAHLESYLIKQGMLFLHVSSVLDACRGIHVRLHTSYAEAYKILKNWIEINPFKKFSKNGKQGDWSMIINYLNVPFFVNRHNIWHLPSIWESPCTNKFLEQYGQRCNDRCVT